MTRIEEQNLYNVLDTLNRETKHTYTISNYKPDALPRRYRLNRLLDESGGVRDVSVYLSRGELYEAMYAMVRLIREERE